MDDAESGLELEPLVARYRQAVGHELAARLDAWSPDFRCIQVYEVIGALLARQATLAKEIANAPTLWNGHSAPILLRAMADVHINVAWLLIDSEIRCLKFVSFGLGQAKLELEHRRADMAEREVSPEELAALESQEMWIDSQRASFLQDVDLGKWAGLSVRQMAAEADCLDFYNYVYTPFSGCAHSMWHHVAQYNLTVCKNPLHRFHRRPVSEDAEPDIHSWLLAAKYWAKTLRAFDAKMDFHNLAPSAYDALLAALSAEESSPAP